MTRPAAREARGARLRWWLMTLAIAVGVVLAAAVQGFEPDVPLVLLASVVAVAAVSLLLASAVPVPETWYAARRRGSRARGQDPALVSRLRRLEDHRARPHPGPEVRDRLAAVADATLRRRHGVGLDHPDGRARLSAPVLAMLEGSPRRLRVRDLDRCLHEIEEL